MITRHNSGKALPLALVVRSLPQNKQLSDEQLQRVETLRNELSRLKSELKKLLSRPDAKQTRR
jgi:hypothetical protein